MFEKIQVTKTIKVPSDKAWLAISRIGGLDCWFPVIKSCKVEGDKSGAIRVLGLQDGGEMTDRIDEVNHQKQQLRYTRVAHPFPVSNYQGTVNVHDAGNGKSLLIWQVEFDVAEADREHMIDFINNVLSAGIDGLEQDLQSK